MPIVFNNTAINKVIVNGVEMLSVVLNGTQVFTAASKKWQYTNDTGYNGSFDAGTNSGYCRSAEELITVLPSPEGYNFNFIMRVVHSATVTDDFGLPSFQICSDRFYKVVPV